MDVTSRIPPPPDDLIAQRPKWISLTRGTVDVTRDRTLSVWTVDDGESLGSQAPWFKLCHLTFSLIHRCK